MPSDVLDVGCGRGEFLALLAERGVSAARHRRQRVDGGGLPAEGPERPRARTPSPTCAAQPSGSLGGLLAAQVVEHLDPGYLTNLLDAAWAALRPGSVVVIETINPACWFAFFESYIRDITHVRPLHPETLKYLLLASGFEHVEIRYRSPYPEHEKLQRVAGAEPGRRRRRAQRQRGEDQPAAVHAPGLRRHRPSRVKRAIAPSPVGDDAGDGALSALADPCYHKYVRKWIRGKENANGHPDQQGTDHPAKGHPPAPPGAHRGRR